MYAVYSKKLFNGRFRIHFWRQFRGAAVHRGSLSEWRPAEGSCGFVSLIIWKLKINLNILFGMSQKEMLEQNFLNLEL